MYISIYFRSIDLGLLVRVYKTVQINVLRKKIIHIPVTWIAFCLKKINFEVSMFPPT